MAWMGKCCKYHCDIIRISLFLLHDFVESDCHDEARILEVSCRSRDYPDAQRGGKDGGMSTYKVDLQKRLERL